MLNYPFDFNKISGQLVERANRFVVRVEVNGRLEEAYLANPGRLWELLLPGTELLLTPARSLKAKYDYTVMACKKEGRFILLHTHLTNKIIGSLINSGLIEAFSRYRVVKEEPAYENHRFDLLLENRQDGSPYYLEIKSCTLFENRTAMFPDAVTGRGTNHLYKLSELAARGLKTGCLFVVMNPVVDYFMPAYHIDLTFARAFLLVRDAVNLQALALGFDPDFRKVNLVKPVTIPYPVLEKELHDRGVYMLLIEIDKSISINIGSLGQVEFQKGYYVYIGSAMNSLSKRIARHRRKKKVKRWHIDYLSAEAASINPVPINTGERMECELAKNVQEITDSSVHRFGSSDCNCPSHLFYFATEPLKNWLFIKLIQNYRILRLEEKISEGNSD